jgi:hypothetical protein
MTAGNRARCCRRIVRLRADTPRVQQLDRRLKHIHALQEERPLLRILGFGRGQVDDELVGFDLPEVGQQRALQCDRRSGPPRQIDASCSRCAVAKWRWHRGISAHESRDRERHDREVASWRQSVERTKLAVPRHVAACIAGCVGPAIFLSGRADEPAHLKSPGRNPGAKARIRSGIASSADHP